MTPETQALAERLAAHPRFRHEPPPPGTASLPQQTDPPCARDHAAGVKWLWSDAAGWSPDLDDPATGGVLLGMLDAATDHDFLATCLYSGGWQVEIVNPRTAPGEYDGPSLGAACAAALLAAWGAP